MWLLQAANEDALLEPSYRRKKLENECPTAQYRTTKNHQCLPVENIRRSTRVLPVDTVTPSNTSRRRQRLNDDASKTSDGASLSSTNHFMHCSSHGGLLQIETLAKMPMNKPARMAKSETWKLRQEPHAAQERDGHFIKVSLSIKETTQQSIIIL